MQTSFVHGTRAEWSLLYHTASLRTAIEVRSFRIRRAASLDEACSLLARHGDDAKLIAGGQSLVPMMAMRLVRPAFLVDINEIAALRFVRRRGTPRVPARARASASWSATTR